MTFKVKISVLLFAILISAAAPSCDGPDREKVSEGALTVALDMDLPGLFPGADSPAGLQVDILESYAAARGMQLRLLPGNTAAECAALLAGGRADMAVSMAGALPQHSSQRLYDTDYCIVSTAPRIRKISDTGIVNDALNGSRIAVCAAFRTSGAYHKLTRELPAADMYVSSRPAMELMDEMVAGKYDFVVCDRAEAALGSKLIWGVGIVGGLGERTGIEVAFNPGMRRLPGDFRQWLEGFRADGEYDALTAVYTDPRNVATLAHRVLGSGNKHRPDVISPYDKIMRSVCEAYGYDWRLISAIAYNESRFNPDVVSGRGARGLMQIMPATARQFGVAQSEVLKPEVNIALALKLLGEIEKSLGLPAGISPGERMKFVLASYNCGVGHVADARRLATKYGANPNRWDDVSDFLSNKGRFAGDPAVKCGALNGKHTLAFVDNVMSRYSRYCSVAEI